MAHNLHYNRPLSNSIQVVPSVAIYFPETFIKGGKFVSISYIYVPICIDFIAANHILVYSYISSAVLWDSTLFTTSVSIAT